ncbi:MAG: Hsp20 family protein [Pyrinomonadaceae bacterium]
MEKHPVKVKSTPPTLLEELENLRSRIAKRAFELFTDRGGRLGLELDDWFRAERELVSLPPIEIAETDKYVEVRVALPGFKSEEVEVFVEPRSVTIKGERKEETHTEKKNVKYSDFRSGEVFRQFQLPSEAIPDEARAVLKDGILSLTLPKTGTSEKKIEVNTGAASAA